MEQKIKTLKNWIPLFLLGLALIIVYKTLDNFTSITAWINRIYALFRPLLIAAIIAYLLYIPSRNIEKLYEKSTIKIIHKKRRLLSILTTYIIAILVIIIAVNFVLPMLQTSITEIVSNVPSYYRAASEYVNTLPEDSWLDQLNLGQIFENIENINIEGIFSLEHIIQYAKGILGVASGILSIFVTMIVSIYLLLYRNDIEKFFSSLSEAVFSPKTHKYLASYFNKSNEVFFKFIGGQVLDSFIVGILVSIVLAILGVKYAILLGFMIGLFQMIPYFGAIVAVTIACIITIFTGGFSTAIWMFIIILTIQQIDANIINPRILGTALNINPLLVIISVLVGGEFFGIMGMFLAVPIATVLKLLLEDFIKSKQEKFI